MPQRSDYRRAVISCEHRRTGSVIEHELKVPLDLALGRFDRLSDLQVREAVTDLLAELEARATGEAARRRAHELFLRAGKLGIAGYAEPITERRDMKRLGGKPCRQITGYGRAA